MLLKHLTGAKWAQLATVAAMAVIVMANSGGRAATQGQGNTGAPGDETILGSGAPRTCQSCHNNGLFNPQISITPKDGGGNVLTNYGTEQIELSIALNALSGNPAGYGFQALALLNNGQVDVAGFSTTDPKVQIANASGNGRQYAEHNSMATSGDFHVLLTPPPPGSGPMTIYVGATVVNGNGANSGDNGLVTTLVLPEQTTDSRDFEPAQALSLAHISESGELLVRTHVAEFGEYLVRVYDMAGKLYHSERVALQPELMYTRLQPGSLPQGVVLVQITGRGRQYTAKGIARY
jgi:hypothetical protein